ncbi:MAG TPA: 8-amino-7-oxononanoate synthase [Burkholderiales bacterium]|nr:8-amino-7-oxononanoate synthase [Burkholderiales bacterium]
MLESFGRREIEYELQQLESLDLRRQVYTQTGPQGTNVDLGGSFFLSFCSNDYLGLANHPEIVEALGRGATRYGVGAGGSHLVCGHMQPHAELEIMLAKFVSQESALLFGSGYLANLGILTTLADRHTTIFADRLNHASLNEGALLSRAKLVRYQHKNINQLDQLMSAEKVKKKLVVTDGVFSMDGDIAPIQLLADLCTYHDAWLVIDDAHGFGLQNEGRGSLYGIHHDTDQIVYMGTLSKAMGGYGAFVAGPRYLIDFLIQRAKSYIYTTAIPPALAYAMCHALHILGTEQNRRDDLTELIRVFKNDANAIGLNLMPSDTPIQPLMMGSNSRAISMSRRLFDRGIWVPAIRPPTVPQGEARLRVSLCASHDIKDLHRLLEVLNE